MGNEQTTRAEHESPLIKDVGAFRAAIGLRLRTISASRVTGSIDLGADQHQPFGIVHGGVYAAAAEESASLGATAAVQDQDRRAVGVSNTTNFIRPMSEGRVEVEAVSLHQGRTHQLWEVRFFRQTDNALVALSHVRLQNVS